MRMTQVQLGEITIGNALPMVLLGGVNVLEDEAFALRCAGHYQQVCGRLGIPLVFKASYDKANRSSIYSYRGPGLTDGLRILQCTHLLRASLLPHLEIVQNLDTSGPVADILRFAVKAGQT